MKKHAMKRALVAAAALAFSLAMNPAAMAADDDPRIGTTFSTEGIVPVFASENELAKKNTLAVLFFNHTRRFDLNAVAEFVNGCGDSADTMCFMVDGAISDPDSVRNTFTGAAHAENIYIAAKPVDGPMPYALFIRKGKVIGVIEGQTDYSNKTGIFLSYLREEINNAELERAIAAVESEEHHRKIIPRMNFVMMLTMKGLREPALKEMAKIDVDNLTAQEKTLVGEAYLRLREPQKAAEVLESCDSKSVDCLFYLGIAHYLLQEFDQAEELFLRVRPEYPDTESVDKYLEKIKNAKGK